MMLENGRANLRDGTVATQGRPRLSTGAERVPPPYLIVAGVVSATELLTTVETGAVVTGAEAGVVVSDEVLSPQAASNRPATGMSASALSVLMSRNPMVGAGSMVVRPLTKVPGECAPWWKRRSK